MQRSPQLGQRTEARIAEPRCGLSRRIRLTAVPEPIKRWNAAISSSRSIASCMPASIPDSMIASRNSLFGGPHEGGEKRSAVDFLQRQRPCRRATPLHLHPGVSVTVSA